MINCKDQKTASDGNSGGYYFGKIQEFNLEQIETEVLNESIYLDVFAGSDLRLKKNITPIEGALSKILQLEGVRFEWDCSSPGVPKKNGASAGLIAQEVAAVMPELVRSDRETGMLGVEYGKLVSYLVEAIKDLNTTVMAQESRIRALEKAQEE